MTPEQITLRQFHDAGGVEEWRVVDEGECTYFRTTSLTVGTRLVQAISELEGIDS